MNAERIDSLRPESSPTRQARAARQFRLLTIHYGLYQLPAAMAGGFVGAFLLKRGFSFPAALAAYAALLMVRFTLRFVALGVAARVGARAALALGVCVAGLQFIPLLHAERLPSLFAWMFAVSAAESLYWPTYHATMAVTGGGASRGRELGLRTAVGASVGIIGPLCGGVLLARYGAAADFAIAGLLCFLSAVPVLALERVDIGRIPTLREAFNPADLPGVAAFASDGWLNSGLALAWPMALFVSLDYRYGAFGLVNALAGLAGAGAGLVCGGSIDRGGRDRYLSIVSWALALSFALRVCAGWSVLAAMIANATGAIVIALYTPVMMTGVYERAKSSGAPYRFHFAAEAGWDAGASFGCLAGAAVVWATHAPSLSVLPAALGIFAVQACVKSHAAHGRTPLEAARSGAPS